MIELQLTAVGPVSQEEDELFPQTQLNMDTEDARHANAATKA